MRSDSERPADEQINTIYRCVKCNEDFEIPQNYCPPDKCSSCGGDIISSGYSYPSDPDDWDEIKVNGEWIKKSDIPTY